MTLVAPLVSARENALFLLNQSLTEVGLGQYHGGDSLSEAAFRYHVLGITDLLEEADVTGFTHNLCKAGQVDQFMRLVARTGVVFERRLMGASMATPFSDALVAGDLDTAVAIARLAPAQRQEHTEYEDDFLRFRFLHLLIDNAAEPALDDVLARWATVLDGGHSVYWDVSRALRDRDDRAFDNAVEALIDHRSEVFESFRSSADYVDEIDCTEGQVFIHGLALLRLAELRGMSTRREYTYMPSIARIPLGTSLPPAEAWRDL